MKDWQPSVFNRERPEKLWKIAMCCDREGDCEDCPVVKELYVNGYKKQLEVEK